MRELTGVRGAVRLRAGRWTRRRLGVGAAGAAGAPAPAAAGCTPGTREASGGPTPVPGAAGAAASPSGVGEQVTVAMNMAPVSLEPTAGFVSWNLRQLGLGETLSRVTRQGTAEPWLARSRASAAPTTRW